METLGVFLLPKNGRKGMKENGEWEEKDLEIDDDMEVDCDISQEI